MTTKEWLKRAYDLDGEIDMLTEERQRAFDKVCAPSRDTKSERVQTSKQNLQEDWSVAYIEYTQRIEVRTAELWEIKSEIFDVINQIADNKLRQLLICRYIMFLTWEQTAERLGYSHEWVSKGLHKRALRAAAKYIKVPESSL